MNHSNSQGNATFAGSAPGSASALGERLCHLLRAGAKPWQPGARMSIAMLTLSCGGEVLLGFPTPGKRKQVARNTSLGGRAVSGARTVPEQDPQKDFLFCVFSVVPLGFTCKIQLKRETSMTGGPLPQAEHSTVHDHHPSPKRRT